jgi:toxin CcdB
MQHDLFVNPSRRGRSVYPFIVVLQADVVEADTRIVAPLAATVTNAPPRSRALPLVPYDGREYVVMMRLIGVLPARHLRQPVGSIARYRADITRALDWLFFGI